MQREVARVKPVPSGEWEHEQSRFAHLPKVPFRFLISGKSASGKGVLTVNAVTNFYRDCFERIYVFAATVEQDNTWQTIAHYAYRHLNQRRREQFMFDQFDEAALAQIVENQKIEIARQKNDPDRKKLKGILVILDDLSDDSAMKRMANGILNRIMTTGRHYGISLWANVHSITSMGSLARRQATAIVVFRIASGTEYKSLKDQYGKIAGSDESFDKIYETAVKDPYSFLTIIAASNDPRRMFMLRFEAWLVPEDLDE